MVDSTQLSSEDVHPRTGVADYFAVLGVGDILTWKHTQKQQTTEASSPSSTPDEDTNNEGDPMELNERMSREIMDVDILVVDGSHLDLHPSPAVLSEVASTTDHSVDHNKTKVHASPLSSPSHSEATTAAASSVPTVLSSSQLQRRTADGWCLVEQTLPSATPIYAPSLEEEAAVSTARSPSRGVLLWKNRTVWDANLDSMNGLGAHVQTVAASSQQQQQHHEGNKPLKGLRRKVESTLTQFKHLTSIRKTNETAFESHQFYLAFRRREQSNFNQCPDLRPAVADLKLSYVRIHCSNLTHLRLQSTANSSSTTTTTTSKLGELAGQILERYQSQAKHPFGDQELNLVNLRDYIALPDGFDEWAIPNEYQWIRDPHSIAASPKSELSTTLLFSSHRSKTHHHQHDEGTLSSQSNTPTSSGIEAVETVSDTGVGSWDPLSLFPKLLDFVPNNSHSVDDKQYHYIPVVAVRRQRVGDEERYHEDPGIADLTVTFVDQTGPVLPQDTDDDDDDEDGTFHVLGKSEWVHCGKYISASTNQFWSDRSEWAPVLPFGSPTLLARRNVPFGFADAAFATRVLGRFPQQNYKNLPLPVEELPMFCYPTGCRLYRARLSDAPVAQYYGFVVKNERGDSIYVSCVSFMEPLTPQKLSQLESMSVRRARSSLPHRNFCEKRGIPIPDQLSSPTNGGRSASSTSFTQPGTNILLTSFDEVLTFENKTICLVSRFPFWTAFRKFLLNMHILSGSSSDLPLERLISHLLLTVPLPKPGGANILIPLSALSGSMILSQPPEKDFPLLDLPYQRLFACLEIKTIVMIVLSLLTLERKLIVMSTRPSLVLDVCELLRSLLFPFDLCAPYVPRLTEPFKSSLDFPGAIFVGIHDDGRANGLASLVRLTCPEDAIVVNLDNGEIFCDADRFETLTKAWDIIPSSPRSTLVTELETLCRDAGIVDGQEPLDSQYDESFDVSLQYAVHDTGVASSVSKEPFDDRAVRDAFLRFFCAVLGGYERYLVVPDADFLISGNEWFDAKGYLASVPHEYAPYLNSLVSTQLFQSFIQRRTEASDMHCLLFDESLTEFHASTVPYGRLGGDVEVVSASRGEPQHTVFSLLVDQSAAIAHNLDSSSLGPNKSFDTSEADSLNLSRVSQDQLFLQYSEYVLNADGDLITAPSHYSLPLGRRYMYCVEGHPCFPHIFQDDLFYPLQPESWLVEVSNAKSPLLSRSERELEEANRRRRLATSHRGYQAQRRCLWQLPKLMGSHFLGAWLLCIPSLVSQSHLSHDQQSRYLLRALGALRILRSKQRIVPDEAAYRALIVACGRNKSDRRVEVCKLFGLLRSDGIFPSAVTLGQYTKALAEGYSKRSTSLDKEDELGGVEVTESGSRVGRVSIASQTPRLGTDFETFDPGLLSLEEQGRRWRHRGSPGFHDEADKKKQNAGRAWLPVSFSTSFVPSNNITEHINDRFRFISLWSRTRGCTSCSYVPLEEEVQAGWDVVGGEHEIPGSIACPRCGTIILPMLAYKEMSFQEAMQYQVDSASVPSHHADFDELPPQIASSVDTIPAEEEICYVAYISPATLRLSLEQYVEEYGEECLERERLKELDPEVFYNFFWFCARFSLPFPLPCQMKDNSTAMNYCAMAGWDRAIAERGCWSAARVIAPVADALDMPHLTKDVNVLSNFDDFHLLSRFNLQAYYSSVWDHTDLSQILVSLVEACDKRDFRPVVETVYKCNKRRNEEYNPAANTSIAASDMFEGAEVVAIPETSGLPPSVELDLYRTVLYLAKYQCATAFHAFFPATMKSCKGYHYWCAIGTPLPMFDRLLRDGVQRHNKESRSVISYQTPSEVALGFRCVFGHLI